MATDRKRLPPWLFGLIVAAVVFAVVAIVLTVLGYGDDPVVEGLAAALG